MRIAVHLHNVLLSEDKMGYVMPMMHVNDGTFGNWKKGHDKELGFHSIIYIYIY